MIPELEYVRAAAGVWVARLRRCVAERGAMTTEAVIITAVLATLAIAATGIIVSKVTAKAQSINLN